MRIETQEIGVGDEDNLRLLSDARDIRGYRPAHHSLNYRCVSLGEYLDDFDTEIGDRVRKGAPDAVKAAPKGDDTVPAIGRVSSFCIVGKKSEHAFNIMSVVGSEKFSGDRLYICAIIHIVSFCTVTDCKRATYAMVRTMRKRALPDIIFA
ncbi:MAG TPA: hypothetical protein VGH13_02120 [Xanthobacteraceae bacterium]